MFLDASFRGKRDRIVINNMEVVYNGWLVKSPPEKRRLKAKWRQRWFVLRHSGLLPGQFLLEYYTDESCRKLKGKIDLDQCEQVDAGLTFESRKSNYKFMFDIRTPKRTYYLVAETEVEMNKWVECICSVCGLKIHIDEEYPPPPPQEVISSPPSSSTLVVPPATNLVSAKSGSNPYIPISECITGKPIANGSGLEDSFSDFPVEAPPPPPKIGIHEKFISDKFYDHPRPFNDVWSSNVTRTSSEPIMEDVYKIPPPLQSSLTSDQDNVYNSLIEGDVFSSVPPKVNWNTYPSGPLPNEAKYTIAKQTLLGCADLPYDSLPPSSLTKNVELGRGDIHCISRHLENVSVSDSGNISQCSTSHQDVFDGASYSKDSYPDSCIEPALKPPPRPPKPSSLREKKIYENVDVPLSSPKDEKTGPLYDIPPTSISVFLSDNLPTHSFAYLKDDSSDKDDLSPSTKVPLLDQGSKETLLDDMYDFPKFRTEDKLNILVPLPGAKSSQRHRHDYTNAPPGLFSNKETVFNYEYRPSLPSSDGYLSMDPKHLELYTEMTNDTCSINLASQGTYANIATTPTQLSSSQSDAAPPVNRDLKPKRKFSDGDVEGGIATVLVLAPPIGKFRSATKRSFRRPRAAPSPTPSVINGTPPPLPTRLRHSDHSTSDDELSSSGGSRRNSANEEQARQFVPAPLRKGEEIQYLDLDLDSDTPAQSPKSPEKLSTSTVYKKVDFVKTKAFNEMRQNVEESYRKSQ